MRKLALILSATVLIACGVNQTETQTDFSNITFSMDTVVVDPGDEIINLKYGLWSSTMSEDNKFLYLWNNGETTLDKINLEELRLEKKIQFESEGPNGVGRFVGWLSFLNENEILLSGFGKLQLFDMEGKKIREYAISKETNFQEGDFFGRNPILLENGELIYGYLGNWISNSMSFVKADFKEKKLRKFDLEGSQELPDYRIEFIPENMGSIAGPEKSVKKVGDLIIVSSSAYNRLYIFDLKKDSIYQVNYTPKLTQAGKKGGYPEKLDSEKRFREVMAEIEAEISFQPPVWDPSTKRYYRFSYETIPSEISDKPLSNGEEKKSISKVYLTVLDENFNLLGESLLTQMQEPPSSVFVKDGKIWFYVNVDDELGFVRMSFD